MAKPIVSVEIEAYDDGTYEVERIAAGEVDNEATEPQNRTIKSLDEAMSKAREMLSAASSMKPAKPAMPAIGVNIPTAREKPGVLSMR